MKLYSSCRFALTGIRVTGKKQVAGTLCFEGLDSPFGERNEVLALEDGIVLAAGRCPDPNQRSHRLGVCVMLAGHNGVTVTYGRLAARFVKRGQYVRAGERIGLEGDTGRGKGQYLTLEFRRNNRRIDGCEYLGIPHSVAEFSFPPQTPEETVCSLCGLDESEKACINAAPDPDSLWQKLSKKLCEMR